MTDTFTFTPEAPQASKPSFFQRRWVQVAGAALIGLTIGGFGAGSNAAEQEKIALAATEQAEEAKATAAEAEDKAEEAQGKVAAAEAKAASAESKAKADAAAALATDRAAVDKIKADAEAAAKKVKDELAKQKADLDARAAALTGQEAEAKKNEFEGDGIYRVGADIAPGTYKSEGGSGNCYYERLSSLTAGGIDGIIDNDNVTGPVIIQIRPTDAGLKVSGCGTFRKVG